MPLQWLNLQQRQRQMPQQTRQPMRSPVSEALTPTRIGGAPTGIGFVERQKAKWAEEDKLRKMERDRKVEEAQEMGMRIRAAYEKEKLGGRQVSAQAPAGAPAQIAATKQIEANPEPAAKEMYELLKTLPDEIQNVLLQQIFTPTEPAGTMTSAGKTVTMPEKHNAIADVFLSKGWATMSAEGKPVLSKPEREFEKTTFKEMSDGSILNTATGEVIAKAGDVPADWGVVYTEVLAEGLKHVDEMMDASWMQTMDTDEMNKHIQTKKTEYRDWIASRLFSRGMTDKDEINRLADLAIGSYDWQKHLDEAKAREKGTAPPTPPPTETNRGLPLDEEVVSSLKQLFKDNPGELDIIEQYKDEYGEVNVNKALEEEVKPTPVIPPPKPLPVKEKEVGRWDVLMKTIEERR